MNISEIEKLIGISKQTIRFYEKEGLISSKRNRENQYREYDEQDIRQLKVLMLILLLQRKVWNQSLYLME